MNWIQSTFVENCPIHRLTKTGDLSGQTLARIEYLLDEKEWTVEVLNGYGKANMKLDINKADKVKKLAEEFLESCLTKIQEDLKLMKK